MADDAARIAQLEAENAALRAENGDLRGDLSEALEQKIATAEILKMIASSPNRVQPVLDAIVASAHRLTDASEAVLWRVDGQNLLGAAHSDPMAPVDAPEGLLASVRPIDPSSPGGQAALRRQTIRVDDIAALGPGLHPETRAAQRRLGFRSQVAAPLVREGEVIGVLVVNRMEVRPFSDKHVALLETFADQAVIAIENARLFEELERRNKELSETLEQQTATAEVLRVIATAPSDLHRVLTTLVESAARLCDAPSGILHQYRERDGRLAPRTTCGVARELNVSIYGDSLAEAFELNMGNPIERTSVAGRAYLDGCTVHVVDLAEAVKTEFTSSRESQREMGQRSNLAVPLMWQGQPIGVLTLQRFEVKPFTQQQIRLLETFADQAVIAIENARLFQELEQRTMELTGALGQQTALAEVLRVIASSPSNLQQVLTVLVAAACRLIEADGGATARLEGDEIVLIASSEPTVVGRRQPIEGTVTGRALLEARTIHVHGTAEEQLARYPQSGAARQMGTQVVSPLLLNGRPIGTLALNRRAIRPYTEQQIALLETFADQAVIAIENARLFEELEQRNAQLQESNRQVTEALEQQTATAEVLRVIASSPTDMEVMLQAILDAAARLCGADHGRLLQRRESDGKLAARATTDFYRQLDELWRQDGGNDGGFGGVVVSISRDSIGGRAFLDRRTIMVADIAEQDEFPEARQNSRRYFEGGFPASHTQLTAPLLLGGAPIGVLTLYRTEVRPFSEKQIALLESFADQAVIAIETARLFQELQQRTAELTRSVEEQQALAEVSQTVSSSLDLQEVLTTIVAHATRLAGADAGTVWEFDDLSAEFVHRASYGMSDELIATIQHGRPSLHHDSGIGRSARDGIAVQSPDIDTSSAVASPISLDALRRAGFRAMISVPLFREQRVIGMLVIRRKTPGEFPPAVVALLETFASQSVLAIENARLFQEVEETSRELAVASQHKSQFLANMSHELRTPLNAIIGYSEMLQEEAEDLDAETFLPDLQRINGAGKHLLGLINDILDLSRIEAGRMDLYIETFEVGQLVQDVAAIVLPLVVKNGNTLVIECPNDIGAMQADQTKVRQTLFNLLSNAAKFTDHGVIGVTVAQESDDWVTFSVSDTGIGMTEEQLGRLFEAFSQAEASTRSTYGGTGLGLAISRHFCLLMGGDLTVSSVYGQGSTFTMRLPSTVVEPAAP